MVLGFGVTKLGYTKEQGLLLPGCFSDSCGDGRYLRLRDVHTQDWDDVMSRV